MWARSSGVQGSLLVREAVMASSISQASSAVGWRRNDSGKYDLLVGRGDVGAAAMALDAAAGAQAVGDDEEVGVELREVERQLDTASRRLIKAIRRADR